MYSASAVATHELPHMDVSLRGAVSLGRRLQDPLAEYVKIDPKSLSVGMYQHDVNQKALGCELDRVVSLCVNAVGVDLNTASPALLKRVAGLGGGGGAVAHAVVELRGKQPTGRFERVGDVARVKGLGAKGFQQAAGFLRVYGGDEDLDATSVHPESYAKVRDAIARLLQKDEGQENELPALVAAVASEVGLGVPTLLDALEARKRDASVDPREDLLGVPPPELFEPELFDGNDEARSSSSRGGGSSSSAAERGEGKTGESSSSQQGSLADLKVGALLEGVVKNVVDFGAFVDLKGVQCDGLLHVSRFKGKTQMVVGTRLRVRVTDLEVIDLKQKKARISLELAAEG